MDLLARMRTTLRARARTRRSSPSPSSPRTRTTLREVQGEGRELTVKVKDANAPSAVKFCPSGTLTPSGSSHGYVSFSDVLRRASDFPEAVPVMFNEASPRESRRGLLAATYPLVFA